MYVDMVSERVCVCVCVHPGVDLAHTRVLYSCSLFFVAGKDIDFTFLHLCALVICNDVAVYEKVVEQHFLPVRLTTTNMSQNLLHYQIYYPKRTFIFAFFIL